VRIWLIAFLSLPGLGMTCGPSASPPPPDDCASPGEDPISAVALGPERIGDRPFQPWAANDTAYVTQGAQGGHMLGVSIELAGDPAPACLAQHSEVRQDGALLVDDDVSINTYDQVGDDRRITNTLWLVFDEDAVPALDSELDVTTEAGGMTASAHLTVVSDRHELVSLAPAAPTARVGDIVQFTLTSLLAPAGAGYEAQLETAGDPGVLSLPAPTAWIYSESVPLMIAAAAPGTAELVVRYGEQEVRGQVTVE
jgi:hypothetical protein